MTGQGLCSSLRLQQPARRSAVVGIGVGLSRPTRYWCEGADLAEEEGSRHLLI